MIRPFLVFLLILLFRSGYAQTWSALDSGMVANSRVTAIAAYHGKLYAGGLFDSAGLKPMNNIARWNGSSWDSIPGVNSWVYALCVYNDKLIAGGLFSTAGTDTTVN
ncbi:MAG TPA: hypothetical protein VNZ86_07070, partial [Bacteroidia bacterium]|nr:hypothetical protein [Bacteroidia bacterium]